MFLKYAVLITLSIPVTFTVPDSIPAPTMATLKPAVTISGEVSGRGDKGYGGHGGGGYGQGGGGYGHGAVTMDPVSILGLLSLGAFLIRSILSLIGSTSARSSDPVDLDVPLQLSDIADIADRIHSWEPTHVVRERSVSSEVTTFLQTTFQVFQKGAACSRKILCERWKSRGFAENRLEDLFLVSLAGWVGDASGAALYDAVSKLHDGDHPIYCPDEDNETSSRTSEC